VRWRKRDGQEDVIRTYATNVSGHEDGDANEDREEERQKDLRHDAREKKGVQNMGLIFMAHQGDNRTCAQCSPTRRPERSARNQHQSRSVYQHGGAKNEEYVSNGDRHVDGHGTGEAGSVRVGLEGGLRLTISSVVLIKVIVAIGHLLRVLLVRHVGRLHGRGDEVGRLLWIAAHDQLRLLAHVRVSKPR